MRAVRGWSADGIDVVLKAVGPATLPQALDMLRPGSRLINILTTTADSDIESGGKEAERRGLRKIVLLSYLSALPNATSAISLDPFEALSSVICCAGLTRTSDLLLRRQMVYPIPNNIRIGSLHTRGNVRSVTK
jgi:hypothetical protein